MNLVIKKSSIDELENSPNINVLLEAYANELAIDGLPHPSAKIEMYRQMESLGILHPFAAYVDDVLVGLINILLTPNPHYGVVVPTTESFFVLEEQRNTGAGLKLLDAAEEYVKGLGYPGMFVSTPENGPLMLILPRRRYKMKSCSFFRNFSDA